MDRKLLVDGDVLLYETTYQTMVAINPMEGLWQWFGDADCAVERFLGRLRAMMRDAKCDSCHVMFSGRGRNFRLDVYPQYKCRRDHQKKRPVHFNAVLEKLMVELPEAGFQVSVEDTIEADDLLGIYATQGKQATVLCTIDKDLRSIPGIYMDLRTHKIERIMPDQAGLFFMTQCISGDPVDDIPGCPKIGKIRAARALKGVPEESLWDAVVECYDRAGLGEEEALTTARLVYILHDGDYNFDTKEVVLWSPKQ